MNESDGQRVTCGECDGSGQIEGDECWRCEGDGAVTLECADDGRESFDEEPADIDDDRGFNPYTGAPDDDGYDTGYDDYPGVGYDD